MTSADRLEFIKRAARRMRPRQAYTFTRRGPIVMPQPAPHQRARGARHGRAKLHEQLVRAIRQLRANGWEYREVAAIVGLPVSTVSNVIRRKTWGHVL